MFTRVGVVAARLSRGLFDVHDRCVLAARRNTAHRDEGGVLLGQAVNAMNHVQVPRICTKCRPRIWEMQVYPLGVYGAAGVFPPGGCGPLGGSYPALGAPRRDAWCCKAIWHRYHRPKSLVARCRTRVFHIPLRYFLLGCMLTDKAEVVRVDCKR